MKKVVVNYLREEVDKWHLPGAVILVSHKGKVILKEAVGFRSVYPEKEPMKLDTVFDLASLTKVVATLPAVLKLKDSGAIQLRDSVQKFIPHFANHSVTIQHLLTHTSGLPTSIKYYKTNFTFDEIIHYIGTAKMDAPAGTQVVYSDTGFIVLKKIVEAAAKQEFTSFLQKEFFTPLQMNRTLFNPTFPKDRYAATEYSTVINNYKCGEVHDENAFYMGGISGHAGLFSTADDLGNFAEMIENNGDYQGKQLLKEETVVDSKKRFTADPSDYRGLGWQLKGEGYNACGDLFSDESYGHTGFTGTSIWFDPRESLHIILLTNRVHLGRERNILSIRERVHTLVREGI